MFDDLDFENGKLIKTNQAMIFCRQANIRS